MIMPQRVGEEKLEVGAVRVAREGFAKLKDGLRVQLAVHVQPGERPGGKLYLARGAPIALRVQPLDLLLQVDVAGNLLEGALQMPDGLVNRAALVIALADADGR